MHFSRKQKNAVFVCIKFEFVLKFYTYVNSFDILMVKKKGG